MPACKKGLTIYKKSSQQKGLGRALTELFCIDSLGHEGDCQFHLQTDGKNNATGEKGVVAIIHMAVVDKKA